MKLTEYTIIELIPFVTGDNEISIRRSGPQLVSLFNKYGCRDVYNSQNGGLPKLSEKQTLNTSRNDILEELDKAKVSIILAMAWFTNNVLLDKLREKRDNGIRIEIVIYDDGVNSKHGVNLTGFDYIKIKAQRGGIMHNKFCVIDNQVIIHGSYNWSNNAEYRNDETVTITEDPNLATEFSVKFRELKSRN